MRVWKVPHFSTHQEIVIEHLVRELEVVADWPKTRNPLRQSGRVQAAWTTSLMFFLVSLC